MSIFGYVWLLILAAVYLYVWAKVMADIKRAREYWGPLEVLKHCDIFTQIWIWGHVVIIFLLSYNIWEQGGKG